MRGNNGQAQPRPISRPQNADVIHMTRPWPGRLGAVLAAWLGVTYLVATDDHISRTTAMAIMIAITGAASVEFLTWRGRTLTLTSEAVISRTGLFPHEIRIPLRHISGIGRDQSPCGVLWGYGHLPRVAQV